MNTWMMALKVSLVGFSAVFIGLLMLTAGVKIMSICCRTKSRKEKKESNPTPAM
jgi:hypothetical protein